MKRVAVLFVVLVVALGTALALKLRAQRLEAGRAAGGSATLEGTEVSVTSRISARVAAVRVREGATVHAGDVLVELQCDEPKAALAQTEAAVAAAQVSIAAGKLAIELAEQGQVSASRQASAAQAAAKATQAQRATLEVQLGAAQRSAARLQKLQAAGAASEQALDQSVSASSGLNQQLRAVGASIDAAQAQASAVASTQGSAAVQKKIAETRALATEQELASAQAARARAQVGVDECTLRAPRDGVVQTRAIEPGEVALPGSRLLTLVDTRELTATFYLPNAELAAAAPGRAVTLVADALPGQKFAGQVQRVSTSAEFTPRNVQTREDRDRLVYAVDVLVTNPSAKLRPGMPVEIAIPGTEKVGP